METAFSVFGTAFHELSTVAVVVVVVVDIAHRSVLSLVHVLAASGRVLRVQTGH